MPAIMQLIQGYVDEFTIEALLSEGFASEQGSSDDLFWAQYTCRNRRTPDGLLNCRVVGEQREDGMRISRIEVADYRTLPAMEAPSNGAAPPAARPATERFRLTADDAFAWSAQPEPDAEVPELPSVAP